MTMRRALVIGAGSGVGQATVSELRATGADVLAAGHERDATDPEQVAALLAEADPDLVVVSAGARPRMASIDEQSWESFSTPWMSTSRSRSSSVAPHWRGRSVRTRPS